MLFLARVSLALFMSCVHQVFGPRGRAYTGNLWAIFNTYKYEGSKKHDDTPNDLIQNFSSIMARLAPIVLNHKHLYLLCHTGGKDVVKISKAKRNCT